MANPSYMATAPGSTGASIVVAYVGFSAAVRHQIIGWIHPKGVITREDPVYALAGVGHRMLLCEASNSQRIKTWDGFTAVLLDSFLGIDFEGQKEICGLAFDGANIINGNEGVSNGSNRWVKYSGITSTITDSFTITDPTTHRVPGAGWHEPDGDLLTSVWEINANSGKHRKHDGFSAVVLDSLSYGGLGGFGIGGIDWNGTSGGIVWNRDAGGFHKAMLSSGFTATILSSFSHVSQSISWRGAFWLENGVVIKRALQAGEISAQFSITGAADIAVYDAGGAGIIQFGLSGTAEIQEVEEDMAIVPHVKHIRHQSLVRQRKSHVNFVAWLVAEAARLASPGRVLRDRVRNLGPLFARGISIAANEAAAGVIKMIGAPNVTFGRIAAVTPGNVGFGSTIAEPNTVYGTVLSGVSLTFASTGPTSGTITRGAGDFVVERFTTSARIRVSGAINDGEYVLTAVTALVLTVNKTLRPEVKTADVTLLNVIWTDNTTNIVVGSIIKLTAAQVKNLNKKFVVTAVLTSDRILVDGDLDPETIAAASTITVLSSVSRAAGDFTADGFLVGQKVLFGGTTANVGKGARIASVTATRLHLLDEIIFEAAAGSRTIDGPSTITRSAGNFVTDGFAAGDLIRTIGSVSNNFDGITAIVGATVITLDTGASPTNEGPSGGISVYKIEKVGRS